MKSALGKGLESLLAIYDDEDVKISKDKKTTINPTNNIASSNNNNIKDGVVKIALDKIKRNENQPRKYFNQEALNDLANSIKVHGVIQPIIVNNNNDGTYTIIAGERRYRASILAELNDIPAIVKNYTPRQIKEISIIENLQRENLNPIETARAIKQLMEEYSLTQETIADRLGKSRPAIANTIRLLTLCPEVIELIEDDKLSAGHARCLVVIEDVNDQIKLANQAISKKLSVRDFEKLIKKYLNPVEKQPKPQQSIELKDMINDMQKLFATKVSAIGNDTKGRIYIDYFTRDDLDRICDLMQILKNKTLTLQDLSNFKKITK